MTLLALLAAAGLAPQDETIETLIERWRSEDPDVRARATDALLDRWKGWGPEELARLADAAEDPDPEVAARARDARGRLRVRRLAGEKVLGVVEGLETAFAGGSDELKLAALVEADRRVLEGKLLESDLEGLAQLAQEADWAAPESLNRFIQQTWRRRGGNLGRFFTLSVDRLAQRTREVEKAGEEGRARAGRVLAYLKDEEPAVRATALRVIGGWGDKELAPKVAPLLKDGHSSVRLDAIRVLGAWDAKEYSRDLVPFLKDPNWLVRWKAAETLSGWGAREYAAEVAPLLKDPSSRTRAEAVAALAQFGARAYAPGIEALLADPSPAVRRNAAFALGKLAAKEAGPKLEALLRDEDPWVRMSAAHALGQFGRGEHTATLLPLLRDPDPDVRADIAWVLGRMASKDLTGHIAELLDHPHAEVRHDVIAALDRLEASAHAPAVAARLGDASGWVRSRAAEALGRIGTKEHLEALEKLLADPERRTRTQAALALGSLGARVGAGPDLVRKLRGLEGDRDRVLGLSASIALVRLGRVDAAGQLKCLDEVQGSGLASSYLGSVFLETVARAREPAAWDKLERPLEPAAPIETWKDVEVVLARSGLKLQVEGDFPFVARVDASALTTARGAIEWVAGRAFRPELVPDGTTLRLLERGPALASWRKRLASK